MEEVWKTVNGASNYEISNMGRLKSRAGRWESYRENPRYVEGSITQKGYRRVRLVTDIGNIRLVFMHVLVAEAFIPNPNPSILIEVNHKDGNKLNNCYTNLEWVTHQENINHAHRTGLVPKKDIREQRDKFGRPVLCITTGKEYPSMMDASEDLKIDRRQIGNVCRGDQKTAHGYEFQYADKINKLLYVHQQKALEKMHNACVLVGGVGSGKSRTALAYYWKVETNRMKRPKDLYVITTARKRDSLDWNMESIYFDIDPYNGEQSPIKFTVDSWNNLHKYVTVTNAFFIFDEQRVVGYGAWTKAFLKICRGNHFILLTATPGDTWMDYIPIFIANGFYRNKTEFITRHVVYARFSKFPKVEKYLDVELLEQRKAQITVTMEFEHSMISHPVLVECDFDSHALMRVYRGRWNIFKDTPIMQSGEWCYVMREVVNSDRSRLEKVLDIFEERRKIIVFYNYDYELSILKDGFEEYRGVGKVDEFGRSVDNFAYDISEYNGHRHDPLPEGDRWVYLVQYNAASEAWNCITTDTIVFYSLNYSYKMMEQASGRIRRMNSPFNHLYYYVLYSKSVIDKSILTALKNKRDFQAVRMYNKIYGGK